MQTYWGVDVYLNAFAVSVLHGGDDQIHATAALNQERAPVSVGWAFMWARQSVSTLWTSGQQPPLPEIESRPSIP